MMPGPGTGPQPGGWETLLYVRHVKHVARGPHVVCGPHDNTNVTHMALRGA
jgi:hypothetical protein